MAEEGGANPDNYGTWSDLKTASSPTEKPQQLSRRDFLKRGAQMAVAAPAVTGPLAPGAKLLEQFSRGEKKNLQTPEIQSQESSISYVIDYFGGETDEATKDRLISSMDANLQPLENLDFSDFGAGDEDEIIRAIRIYQQVGNNELLARLILDKGIEIAGGHGEFVDEAHTKQLERLTGSQEQTKRIGLQNAIDKYGLTVDALGNIHAKLLMDRALLQDSLPPDMPADSVVVGAFQLGEIELSYTHTRVREPKLLTTELNGKTDFIWDYEVEGVETAVPYVVEDGDEVIVKVGNKVTQNYKEYDFDAYDNEAFIQAEKELKEQLVEDRLRRASEGSLTPEEWDKYIEKVPVNERISYVEPYNTQEGLDQFYEFCDQNPGMTIIQALGNNTDTTNLSRRDIKNGILVSGVGGSVAARSKKFGTEEARHVGGIGADIYVEYNDFHDVFKEDFGVMSSSEATGIIGSYAEALKRKGMNPEQIKSALQNNCCVFRETTDLENRLFIGDGQKVSGFVFNKQKADEYIAGLQ